MIRTYLVELKPSGFPGNLHHLVSMMYRWLGKLDYTHCLLLLIDDDKGYGWCIDNTWDGTHFYPYTVFVDLSFTDWHKQARVTEIKYGSKKRIKYIAKVLYENDEAILRADSPGFHEWLADRLGISPVVRGSLSSSIKYWRGLPLDDNEFICTDVIAYLVRGKQYATHMTPTVLRGLLCGEEPEEMHVQLNPLVE